MKKKVFFALIYFCLFSIACRGQQDYPEDVQIALKTLKCIAKNNLENYRHGYDEPFFTQLMYKFRYPDSLYKKAETCNLNIGMLYDEDMRNRMVQLMNNEFSEIEMDSLVRYRFKTLYWHFEKQAFQKTKIDTFPVFRASIKKLYEDLEKDDKIDKHKQLGLIYEFELFKQLQLDTIKEFKEVYLDIVQTEENNFVESMLSNNGFDYSRIAELSGYINDKRFIQPLIAALNKPKNFKQEVVFEALARMKVEPYYTQYIERRTRSLSQIKKERPDFRIEELAEVIRTQESFRELSKYLLSDVPYSVDISEQGYTYYPIYIDAYILIRDNIENKYIQELLSPHGAYEDKEVLQKAHDWMQANYGEYEMKYIW